MSRVQISSTRDWPKATWLSYAPISLEPCGIGNSALRDLYDSFYYRTARVWYEVLPQAWDEQIDALCAELQDLIRALVSGDPKAVAYVERNHLSYYMTLLGRLAPRAFSAPGVDSD